MHRILTTITLSALLTSPLAQAETAVEQLLSQYQTHGAQAPDAQRGEALWYQELAGKSCTSCHGRDLTQAGKHQKTGKLIEPMAPSVNPQRLTDSKQIEKWLYRNCKWTLERECTAQEKSDLLAFLRRQ